MNIQKLAFVVIVALTILMAGTGSRMLPPTSGEYWLPSAIASAGAFIGCGLGLIAVAILAGREIRETPR